MDSAPAVDRLPWLDSPRTAPQPRRGRTALLVLLGLFLAATIAVMAFLAGRSSAPVAAPAPAPAPRHRHGAAAPVRVSPSAAASVPVAPVARPSAAEPAPPVIKPRTVSDRPSAAALREEPGADVRPTRAPSSRIAPRDPRRVERAVSAPPSTPLATPVRTVRWPARPFDNARGRVVQLGAYTTPAQADAEWWRVARAYPYLATLPRLVTRTGPFPGRPRLVRIRLAAPTRDEARALCRTLHRMGRGCIIV